MVAPQDDNRVVLAGACFQGVEQPSQVHVGVSAGGQIGLDRRFPTSAFEKLGVIPIWLCHRHTGGRDIVQVFVKVRR